MTPKEAPVRITAEPQFLDVISVNIRTILISLLNLVLLFLILKHFLFRPVKKILAERQKAVDGDYQKAADAREAAEADRLKYETKLAAADDEAADLLKTANDRARHAEEAILADANRRAAETLRRADEDIAYERKRAVNEIKNEISDISVDIAEKMLEREIRAEDHRELIDRFIQDIGSSDDNA